MKKEREKEQRGEVREIESREKGERERERG